MPTLNLQFEIITGGWVMSDEANSFYYATIEQMMTGQEWLNFNLRGYKPNVGLSACTCRSGSVSMRC